MEDYIARLALLQSLEDFYILANDVEQYLASNVIRKIKAKNRGMDKYEIWTIRTAAGREVILRPQNLQLLVTGRNLELAWNMTLALLPKLSNPATLKKKELTFLDSHGLDSALYSISQLIGLGADCFISDANQARKLFGTAFENLVHLALQAVGLQTKSVTYNRVISTAVGAQIPYTQQIDLVARRLGPIQTSRNNIAPDELMGSIKTSSKDRMPKIYLDKILLERISEVENIKYIGVFHNDIQRSGADGVSVTFVAQLFLIYEEYLTQVNGIYFLDPPPHINNIAFKGKLRWFTELVRTDIWTLV